MKSSGKVHCSSLVNGQGSRPTRLAISSRPTNGQAERRSRPCLGAPTVRVVAAWIAAPCGSPVSALVRRRSSSAISSSSARASAPAPTSPSGSRPATLSRIQPCPGSGCTNARVRAQSVCCRFWRWPATTANEAATPRAVRPSKFFPTWTVSPSSGRRLAMTFSKTASVLNCPWPAASRGALHTRTRPRTPPRGMPPPRHASARHRAGSTAGRP